MANEYGTVVDADEEIFWSKVRQAYARVATNHDEEVVFTIGNREATVSWWGTRSTLDDPDFVTTYDSIMIEVREVDPPQPELIVPLGQGED